MKWVAPKSGFDEVFDPRGRARAHYEALISILESFTKEDVERRERLQQLTLRSQGITFTVYGEKDGLERIFPFDFVPRIIPAAEWKGLQDGLVQRITTLNLFLADIYQDQKCLKDGIVPADLDPLAQGVQAGAPRGGPARKIFTHVVGTDIIRDDRGEYLVLEDNCRVPERRLLRAGEPQPPEPRLPRVPRLLPACGRSRTTRPSCSRPCASWRRGAARTRWWSS